MFIITGTKRSGTSMWMQVLQAAGIDTIGSAFGKHWENTIKEANPLGFHESLLRRGIYYATNPHPETGRWLHPSSVKSIGVKVFVPGVVRSDIVYLSRVIATVRPIQQYVESLERLRAIEAKSLQEMGKNVASARLLPAYEWWLENFLLVRDLITRRYPCRLVSYERVLEKPKEVIPSVIQWLGSGDPDKACAAVTPTLRTATAPTANGIELPQEALKVSEEYYERVYSEEKFDNAFIVRMNDAHQLMIPLIEKQLVSLSADQSPRSRQNTSLTSPDRLEELIHIDE